MRFGIQIEPQFGFTFDEVREIARDAERLGAETVWVSDHLFLNDASAATGCLEAWTLLAALTQVTTSIRLGTLVTCQSYRNPALLAKIAAGVDVLSGGRLDFGIGAGWKELEYRAYGYDFPAPGVRVEQLADTIEICRRMWSEDKATYHGAHYRIDAAQCSPKPVQRPLPMWIAGAKPQMLRLVARYADAVNVGGFPTAAGYASAMAGLDRACAREKRDPATILRSHFGPVLVAETRSRLDEIVRDVAARAKISPAEWLARRAGHPVGTPEEVAEALRAFARLGVAYVIPVFPYGYDRECLRVFAEKVVPALA
ncbi:MAG: LLM class flavin-dependent oxidoreductase [Chloroflexota bacterium]|nr:LLM class flavin-dependent oxidoreductase [Chloroflexota bacterium]